MPYHKPRIALIGSGLAGSVLASRLGSEATVVVFERGPNSGERPHRLETTGHPLGLYPSFMYGLGGTTNLWQGGMIEMRPDETGPAWPKAVRDDLARHYGDVVRCLYGGQAAEAWARRTEKPLAESALLTSIFYPARPYRAAESNLFDNCVTRFDEQVIGVEENDRGITVTSRANGRISADRFDCVVLACGGINSPIVLRRSGLGGAAVGQNFTDHPMGFVAKLTAPSIRSIFARLSAATGSYDNSEPLIKLRDAETGLWSAFYLRPAAIRGIRSDPYARAFGFLGHTSRLKKYGSAIPQLADLDFLYQVVENRTGTRLPSRYCYVLVINEQEPLGQGSVTETPDGNIRLRWTISDAVLSAINNNLETLAEVLDAELVRTPEPLRERLWSAAHHSGTCRISTEPSRGVVDNNLRVHGARQIYVCDGSVLPSTGCTNTGLAIGALAHRLVEHLRKELAIEPSMGASGKSKPTVKLLMSGAGGRIGQMMQSSLVGADVQWQAVNLHEGIEKPLGTPHARVFLHLANAHTDVEENKRLQVRAAEKIAEAGVTQVVVSMSFVTLGVPGDGDPEGSAFNFGFACTSPDSYPRGKLAVEKFWLDWQREDTKRKVLFLYIPTICGTHSDWTVGQARHASGKILLVPGIERFFIVSEEDLTSLLMAIVRRGLTANIERQIALSPSASLADAIAADRSDPVAEMRLPGLFWLMCGMANRRPLIDKGMSVARKIIDILLRKTAGRAIVPISASYLYLFKAQSKFADKISKAARQR